MKKLLLADDSVTIQKVVKLSFADENIEVVAVDNGEQAIQILDEFGPDVVLADVYMPGRNGFAVCEYTKSRPNLAHVPVVLLVGIFEPFDKVEASRVRCDGVLTKPFETSQLVRLVNELLESTAQTASEPAAEADPTPAVGVTATGPDTADASMVSPVAVAAVHESNAAILESAWDCAPALTSPTDEDSILELFDDEPEALGPEPALPAVAVATMEQPGAVPEMPPPPAMAVDDHGIPGPAMAAGVPAAPQFEEPAAGGLILGEREIDLIVRRVLQRLTDQVVREVAWEVVPDMAEILIKERLRTQQQLR